MKLSYGSIKGDPPPTSGSSSVIPPTEIDNIQQVTATASLLANEHGRKSKPGSFRNGNYFLPLLFLAAVMGVALPCLVHNGQINLSAQIDELNSSIDGDATVHQIVAPVMTKITAKEQIALIRSRRSRAPPFSTLDPVNDIHLFSYDNRPEGSSPGTVFSDYQKGQKETGMALPTNEWYENFILTADGQEPTGDQRAYTIPYLINVIGPIPGIKIHATRLLAMEKIVQVSFVDTHGLTLGAAKSMEYDGDKVKTLQDLNKDGVVQRRYVLDVEEGDTAQGGAGGASGPLTPLGLTLQWSANEDETTNGTASKDMNDSFNKMSASIVRGMAYGTMHYHYEGNENSRGLDASNALPTVVSQIGLASPPRSDTGDELKCTYKGKAGNEILVKKNIEIAFSQSDYTWIVFYSEPVYVRCFEVEDLEAITHFSPAFILQATRLASNETLADTDNVLTSRVALMNNCTKGTSPSHCVQGQPSNRTEWSALLKKHADVYPGKQTNVDYTFFSDDEDDGGDYAYLQFDWDARRVNDRKPIKNADTGNTDLLMYSLPHHREMMNPHLYSDNTVEFDGKLHCTPSLNGDACVVKGSAWVLKEELHGQPSFFAPRHPRASTIPNIAKALGDDITYRVPDYYKRGAGDTYFSGKMLAKLSRILLVYKEVADICDNPENLGKEYVRQCKVASIPPKTQFVEALDHLRSSTEIWINGTAETPFVFDSKWGGLVSCGCLFNSETQSCDNEFPNCPSFEDPGLDFGHGFYNDHHFHQGYHIYAAATVAYFDPDWGKEHFENVLLMIRDIANPSPDDPYFPIYRQKDWYQGNSWAGGIAMSYPNGRNQESSSESIAAYEAVSLFGSVMVDAWSDNKAKAAVSRHIREVGRLLTATELRSADRYWHVRHTGDKAGIYPKQYKPLVVGMLWNMMAEFQTWFGSAPHLAYGIQLLPLTPVSERRDDIEWCNQLYPSFAESCRHATDCDEQGWGILQHAILATVGHPKLAIKYAEGLHKGAFTSAGGNGHSLSNSIWYYSTRPNTKPLELPQIRTPSPTPAPRPGSSEGKNDEFNCGCPSTCSEEVLNYPAGGSTCGKRIEWLIESYGKSEEDACSRVAGVEFTDLCAGCDPNRCIAPRVSPVQISSQCPPCDVIECKDNGINRCPVLDAPFLCTSGSNTGGCSMTPWVLKTIGGSNCNKCCELTYKCSL